MAPKAVAGAYRESGGGGFDEVERECVVWMGDKKVWVRVGHGCWFGVAWRSCQ